MENVHVEQATTSNLVREFRQYNKDLGDSGASERYLENDIQDDSGSKIPSSKSLKSTCSKG